jgi:site-specific DNA recombinase
VGRAHVWLNDLTTGRHSSVEDLAQAIKLHPKVVRRGLRLAFLAPAVTAAILEGQKGLKLVNIPKLLPLSWREQQRLLG